MHPSKNSSHASRLIRIPHGLLSCGILFLFANPCHSWYTQIRGSGSFFTSRKEGIPVKIDRIELFKVAPRWLFLKMTTDDGFTGWGEPVCEGKADTVAAAVRELGAQLIGHSATDIEDAFQQMYRTGFYRGGPILTSAISGIEQAMWDIKGKALGVPVLPCEEAALADGSYMDTYNAFYDNLLA